MALPQGSGFMLQSFHYVIPAKAVILNKKDLHFNP